MLVKQPLYSESFSFASASLRRMRQRQVPSFGDRSSGVLSHSHERTSNVFNISQLPLPSTCATWFAGIVKFWTPQNRQPYKHLIQHHLFFRRLPWRYWMQWWITPPPTMIEFFISSKSASLDLASNVWKRLAAFNSVYYLCKAIKTFSIHFDKTKVESW